MQFTPAHLPRQAFACHGQHDLVAGLLFVLDRSPIRNVHTKTTKREPKLAEANLSNKRETDPSVCVDEVDDDDDIILLQPSVE